MPAETYLNVGGNNIKIGATGAYVKVGSWQTVNFIYVNAGGGWQTVYIRDVSGPAAPTNLRATWNGEGLDISWTNPADADYAYMAVNVQPGTAPWMYGPTINAPTNSFRWTNYILNNLIYTVMLTPVDTNGNVGTTAYVQSMEWTGQARGKTPSPTVIWPLDSGTFYHEWGNPAGAWRTDISDRVDQGGFDVGEFIGMYFYGDQFWNLLRGTTVSAASAQFFRVPSGGTPLPVSPAVCGSTCVSKAQNPMTTMYDGPTLGPGLSMAGDPYPPIYNLSWPLPSSLFDNFNSTAQRFNAMALYAADNVLRPDLGGGNVTASYMQMFGASEYPYNIKSGAITLDHSG